VDFISNKGFFKKDAFQEKSSQNGWKMPKWVTILAFIWEFLVTFTVLNLIRPKAETIISKTSDLRSIRK